MCGAPHTIIGVGPPRIVVCNKTPSYDSITPSLCIGNLKKSYRMGICELKKWPKGGCVASGLE